MTDPSDLAALAELMCGATHPNLKGDLTRVTDHPNPRCRIAACFRCQDGAQVIADTYLPAVVREAEARARAERDDAIAAWNEAVDRLSAAWQVYERMKFDPTANHFDKRVWMQHLADLRTALTRADRLDPDAEGK